MNVYVKQSEISAAGRGVFAARDIQKGEIIERCPVIQLSAHDMANLNESILVTYFFFYGRGKKQVLLALGYGSLYNHSYTPNARYRIHHKNMTMDVIAKAYIPKDSEITFDYSGTSKIPLWFDKR